LACGPGHSLAQDLGFHGLLAEQALKLAHLGLQRPVLGRGHHLLAGTRRGQRTLRHQPPPGEELASADAVAAGDQRHAHARQVCLLDDPDLLLRGPAPPALHPGTDLAVIGTPGRKLRRMPHSYPRARPCQVI
jgi:hypothetical protein